METQTALAPVNEKLARQIEELVLKRIAQDSLTLPTMPAVAIKCIEVLRRPEFSFKEAASILEQDPVLAARVLRTATSAAFSGGSQTHSLTEALTRIGAKTAKAVLVEASAAKVFVSRNPQIAEATKRVWQHSVAVGMLARDISALTGGTDSDAAYLAGLLHDVGKPVVAAILLEAERQIVELHSKPWIGSAEWLLVIRSTHRKVGVALTEKWGLPPALCKSIKDCSEYDPGNRSSISNAVCFANALAKQVGIAPDESDIDDARALVMIGRSVLGADEAVINPLVAGLKTKLERLYK